MRPSGRSWGGSTIPGACAGRGRRSWGTATPLVGWSALALLLAACSDDAPSVLRPQSEAARTVEGLWWLTFWTAVVVVGVVVAFILVAVRRGRARAAEEGIDITVFPEDHPDSPDAQTLLIRLPPDVPAQVNPVWLYGPFHADQVPSPAQPDWWLGWVEGALRIFPPWETRAFDYEIPNPFFPGVLLPASASACSTCGRSSRPGSPATASPTTCSTGPATVPCARPWG